MKVAVVYNRESLKVINLFGLPNREKYGLASIRRIANSLKAGGHQVIALEGDKDLIDNLENFMPQVLKGERPGMVFNLSYGIQGQARYTHVPGMLEMVGIPYVGSGPLAHSLALDKVVAKMIFRQQGLPTPDFVVLESPDQELGDLAYPMIVKPKNEAVSMGIKIVENEPELREAAKVILEAFHQPVLAEQYIDGREINVGLLGNTPPETLPPAEITFGEGGPRIYTFEDKTRKSGREVAAICPADIPEELTLRAQQIALRAFHALGCYDCARVDMRIDADGNLFILEVNSLPSLGEHGSYVAAAKAVGLDFTKLVNRLVDVAAARYFGTPTPPALTRPRQSIPDQIFKYLTERRDQLERRVRHWTNISSRTNDPVGIRQVAKEFHKTMAEIGMRPVDGLNNDSTVWSWESKAGIDGGTLLVLHLDIPLGLELPGQRFRRDPEWLYGEGVGASRAAIAMLEFALRSLRPYSKRLHTLPLAVLAYADEGLDCRHSSELIHQAANRASRVLVLRPSNPDGKVIGLRRGLRKYSLVVEGKPRRPGQAARTPEVLNTVMAALSKLPTLSSRKQRVAVSTVDLHSEALPMMLPHRIRVSILLSYPDKAVADAVAQQMGEHLKGDGLRWKLEMVSDRPPMRERRVNSKLIRDLEETAAQWEIPFARDSSTWPSVAGLVPRTKPVLCGIGPAARDLYTSNESVERISLVQRTLLLAQYLASLLKG